MKNFIRIIFSLAAFIFSLEISAQIFGDIRSKSMQIGINYSQFSFSDQKAFVPKLFANELLIRYTMGYEIGYYLNERNVIRHTFLNSRLQYYNYQVYGDVVFREIKNFSFLYQRVFIKKRSFEISGQLGTTFRRGSEDWLKAYNTFELFLGIRTFDDVGINLGANINIPVWRGINLVFDLNYLHSIYRHYHDEAYSEFDNGGSKQMVNLSFGISYAFQRK